MLPAHLDQRIVHKYSTQKGQTSAPHAKSLKTHLKPKPSVRPTASASLSIQRSLPTQFHGNCALLKTEAFREASADLPRLSWQNEIASKKRRVQIALAAKPHQCLRERGAYCWINSHCAEAVPARLSSRPQGMQTVLNLPHQTHLSVHASVHNKRASTSAISATAD